MRRPRFGRLHDSGNTGASRRSTHDAGGDSGAELAIANFIGSSHTDLAIGAPGQSVDTGIAGMGRVSAGGVTLLPGTASGPTSAGSQVWTQDSPGLSGRAAHGEGFGAAIAP